MNGITASVEGTNEEGLCYRVESVRFHAYENVLSIDMQKAIETAVDCGSTKIEIELVVCDRV